MAKGYKMGGSGGGGGIVVVRWYSKVKLLFVKEYSPVLEQSGIKEAV